MRRGYMGVLHLYAPADEPPRGAPGWYPSSRVSETIEPWQFWHDLRRRRRQERRKPPDITLVLGGLLSMSPFHLLGGVAHCFPSGWNGKGGVRRHEANELQKDRPGVSGGFWAANGQLSKFGSIAQPPP